VSAAARTEQLRRECASLKLVFAVARALVDGHQGSAGHSRELLEQRLRTEVRRHERAVVRRSPPAADDDRRRAEAPDAR